jgi:hypothetical protein
VLARDHEEEMLDNEPCSDRAEVNVVYLFSLFCGDDLRMAQFDFATQSVVF